jgi:hypothetical protein
MNLYDMLANAQSGQGMDQLARQFGLSQQQTQAAVEALLPAFSQGLKRNASDPYGVGAFVSAMATGQHARYFEDAQNAFSPQGMQEGNGILGHLFGSKDLSRAVAAQAAQATGLGQQILQQMLPVIASMIMGGLFKQSTGQINPGQFQAGQQAGGFGGSGNPLQEIIEQMMRQGGGGGGGGMPGGQQQQRQAPQQPQGQSGDPFDNPFGKILKDMFGGAIPGTQPRQQPPSQQRRAEPEPEPQNPFGDNPLGKIFEEMLKGAQGGGQTGGQASRPPAAEPRVRESRGGQGTGQGGRPKNPYDDLFGEMFETGSKQRDEYQKGIESIFDQFSKGMDRYR